MREYLEILFCVCVLAAIVRVVAPEGVMKKYIELICALCVICAITLPISQLLYEIQNIDMSAPESDFEMTNYDEIYNSYLVSGSISDIEEILEQEICNTLIKGSGDVDVSIRAQILDEAVNVLGVDVTLIGGAVSVDPDTVRKYVTERTGVECQIIYDFAVEKEKL